MGQVMYNCANFIDPSHARSNWVQ